MTEREKIYGPVVKEEHFWNFPLVMVLGTEEIKKIVRTSPIMRPSMEILTLYRSGLPEKYNTFGLVNSYVAVILNFLFFKVKPGITILIH